MPLFANRNYASDTTDFLNQLRQEHEHLEASQRQGRALLWDVSVDRLTQQQREDFRAARVAQLSYVYQTSPLLPPPSHA